MNIESRKLEEVFRFINVIGKRNNCELFAVLLLLVMFPVSGHSVASIAALAFVGVIVLAFGSVVVNPAALVSQELFDAHWKKEYLRQVKLLKLCAFWYIGPLAFSLSRVQIETSILFKIAMGLFFVIIIIANFRAAQKLEKECAELFGA